MGIEHTLDCLCENRSFFSYYLRFMHDDVHEQQFKTNLKLFEFTILLRRL